MSGIPAAAFGEPTLAQQALETRSVVRFDRFDLDGVDSFSVAAADNPLAAADDFTLAVVFATSSSPLNGPASAWFLNTGLVDASDFFGTTADWGLVLNASGQVGAGLGQPAAAPTPGCHWKSPLEP